jgi:hypothetical protein
MSLDEAADKLRRHGICALLYTSPSHTRDRPRWRVLALTSRPLPPSERRKLITWVNGVLGGVLSPESSVLSQAYYYGRVGDNPDHRAVIVPGGFIDERGDLDAIAIAIGKDDVPHDNLFAAYGDEFFKQPIDVDAELAGMRHRDKDRPIHLTQLRCSASMVVRGASDDAITEKILSATERACKEAGESWAKWESGERRTIDRMISDARRKFTRSQGGGVSINDFYAYMPVHNYIFTPSREPWPAASVNARIPPVGVDKDGKPVKASTWLDQNRPVEQMTWAPGEPMIIRDRLVSEGGFFDRPGVSCFNLYQPPTIIPGDAKQAGRWVDHVHKVYPDDADNIIVRLAHRVQKPQVKINHALFLGGLSGIGKDTIVEPAKRAVGTGNVIEISPRQAMGRFNGFLKSVILRINEARDQGEYDRYQLYETLKPYTASPPDVLRVDEKNLREYSVLNCTFIIITSNHKDSMYLPADDRRYYVAWSPRTKEDFAKDYWNELWGWYDEGGYGHVAAYLAAHDISGFNPKAPPPKTAAFWEIVSLNRPPEDDELADALDKLGNPDAVTIDMMVAREAEYGLQQWLWDRKNRRAIPHRMGKCGYVSVHNESRKDGRWIIGGVRHVVYAKEGLSVRDRHVAAERLARAEEEREAARRAEKITQIRPPREPRKP